MPPSKAVARQHAIVAATARFRPDSPELDAARRDLRAVQLREHIREAVSKWPPLSDAQRNDLAELLVPARQAIRDRRLNALQAQEAEITTTEMAPTRINQHPPETDEKGAPPPPP